MNSVTGEDQEWKLGCILPSRPTQLREEVGSPSTSCSISLGICETPCTESSERLWGKSVCYLWLRQYGTSDQEHYLSSIEYIFMATVSAAVNAHVLGCAL